MTDSPNTTSPADSEPTIDVVIDATRCQSWAAGHRVHWVQGLRAANSSDTDPYVDCRVTDASDDGRFTVVVTATGEELHYWNHDPFRVRSLVGRSNLQINRRWSILRERTSGGGGSGHVSIRSTPSSCVFVDPTGPLHEQLQTHGGFSISGPDALRLIAETNAKAETTDD